MFIIRKLLKWYRQKFKGAIYSEKPDIGVIALDRMQKELTSGQTTVAKCAENLKKGIEDGLI